MARRCAERHVGNGEPEFGDVGEEHGHHERCRGGMGEGYWLRASPDPDGFEPTKIVIVCPVCAEQELGHVAWRHYT